MIVWNVLGHPPRNDLLMQLGVIGMMGGMLKEAGGLPTFPNVLFVVIRDYTLESPASLIKSRLLEPEVEGGRRTSRNLSVDIIERNRLRAYLKSSFLSFEVSRVITPLNTMYRELLLLFSFIHEHAVGAHIF